jgi:hypothetical protein
MLALTPQFVGACSRRKKPAMLRCRDRNVLPSTEQEETGLSRCIADWASAPEIDEKLPHDLTSTHYTIPRKIHWERLATRLWCLPSSFYLSLLLHRFLVPAWTISCYGVSSPLVLHYIVYELANQPPRYDISSFRLLQSGKLELVHLVFWWSILIRWKTIGSALVGVILVRNLYSTTFIFAFTPWIEAISVTDVVIAVLEIMCHIDAIWRLFYMGRTFAVVVHHSVLQYEKKLSDWIT